MADHATSVVPALGHLPVQRLPQAHRDSCGDSGMGLGVSEVDGVEAQGRTTA